MTLYDRPTLNFGQSLHSLTGSLKYDPLLYTGNKIEKLSILSNDLSEKDDSPIYIDELFFVIDL